MNIENNKIIADFPNYEISNIGFVKNIKSGRVLKGSNCRYQSVTLSKDGNKFQRTLHRLVAVAFISNPENKTDVNHIDGNKHSNHYTNLEWVTRSQNVKHAFDNGLNTYTKELREIRALARLGKTHSKETKNNISKGLLKYYNEQKEV